MCTAIIDVCASENHAKHSKRKVVDVCFFEKHKKPNNAKCWLPGNLSTICQSDSDFL